MSEKEDYLTSYRVFFEKFAATVNPEDQLPVHIAGYTITEAELVGEVLYWTTQYLSEKQCPLTLMTPLRRIILDEVRVASKKTPNEFGYKSDESVYIALRLMQAVTARVIDICLRYLDNARLDTLPPPPPLAQRDLKTVSCATKNSRRVMEDRHVEIGNLEALFGIETTEPTSFYAVYDGHAGSAAATYCAAHLHQYLIESPLFTTDLRCAMRDAYLKTDAEFIRKSNQERACGGSTAVTVAVRGRRLLAAWAGDSLALLAKRMRLMQLVRPHKPGRQDERERIESTGGTVLYWGTWRVNGQLAVSRAIGDAQYKPYVTARPEIATVELDGDEDFVVVACDGLWDFVSEDDVALSVYRQIAADPDDLKAVTKQLILQAKRQGSADNISIIVVFLKDPRDIAADNCPPMDLGLDNAMMNVPPFAIDTDVCKRQVDAAAALVEAEVGECAEAEADAEVGGNGVDNSDSDSEDLGPETAVDADDIDAEARHQEPQPPTPTAHTLEEGHVDGAVVDNVAESGEDSEDEWNYYKGEGEREEQNPSEEPDELPRSETPCQDNSAWESSSVDMNSSPLNPDAPVFIPGGVAGADVLLAESPRKPLPMDDIELPDVAQFQTEAVVRPAELLDLDNCDQLNGHHNLSLDEAITEHMNGNDKCNMDSLGFGFNVDIEPDKVKDTGLIQDFERIQKDTTDFCNIQVFQTHAETNPFAVEDNDAIFERLKNKERDPMSMSFYQEKDDDTCDRLSKNELHVDLNAVQPLPDSDDEDIQSNGIYENDKENIPEQHPNIFDKERHTEEPNNDNIRFDDRPGDLPQNIENFCQGDNFVDYNVTNTVNNTENYSNIEFESNITEETVLQTDTPESHKLLFEQIPEIPDGKSSELGFPNDELHDPSISEKEVQPVTPQDVISEVIGMENKLDDLYPVEAVPQLNDQEIIGGQLSEPNEVVSPVPDSDIPLDDNNACVVVSPTHPDNTENAEEVTTETALDENVLGNEQYIDSHTQNYTDLTIEINENVESHVSDAEPEFKAPMIKLDNEHLTEVSNYADNIPAESPLQIKSPLPSDVHQHNESPLPTESPLPGMSPLPTESHLPVDDFLSRDSPLPAELSVPSESPLPDESLLQTEIIRESVSPTPKESPLPSEPVITVDSHRDEASSPVEVEEQVENSLNTEDSPSPSLLPSKSPLQTNVSSPSHSPIPQESELQNQLSAVSPIPSESPINLESANQSEYFSQSDSHIQIEAPIPIANEPIEKDESNLLAAVYEPLPSDPVASPLPADVPLPGESPLPTDEPTVETDDITVETFTLVESDKPLETEEQVDYNSHVQLDIPLNIDTSVKAVVDVHIPSEPEIVLESESPNQEAEVVVMSDVTFEPESEVQRNVHLAEDNETPLEIEAAMEAEAPMEAGAAVEIEIETGVEAEIADELEAPLGTEVPIDAEVAVEDEATEVAVEDEATEVAVEDEATEVAVEAEAAMETEAVEIEVPVESDLKEYSGQPDVLEEPMASADRPVSVEAAPVESHLNESTESSQTNTQLNAVTAKEQHPTETSRTPSPGAPLRADTATPECLSPTPLAHTEARQTPDVPHERLTVSAPAPDLLPEERVPQSRLELITDVDIGIPESRAQEICVPITNEIQLEEAVLPPTASTPPPTPAVEPTTANLDAASLSDTPIAADSTTQAAAVAATTAIAAGAAAGLAAVTAKAKTTMTTKKSPTTPTAKPDGRTPKSAPKSTTSSRTPTAAASAKRPATSAPTARTPSTAKTPSSATKMPVTNTRTTPATRTPTTVSKPATPIAKSSAPTKTTPTVKAAAQARVPTATRAPPSKPNGVAQKTATAAARSAPAPPRTVPIARAAPKSSVPAPRPPAAAKTESAAKPTARPAPRPAPAATKPQLKPADRKPLTNGDAKDLKSAARPAPRAAAPAARPAPRPTPRPAPAVPAPTNKTSAPKPLPRAAPLDKQSKDLANKRITAKTAPPRTAPPKSTAALGVKKAVPKRPLESVKKEAAMNGLSNGDVISKPPPSPPVADNALLPDVIA